MASYYRETKEKLGSVSNHVLCHIERLHYLNGYMFIEIIKGIYKYAKPKNANNSSRLFASLFSQEIKVSS